MMLHLPPRYLQTTRPYFLSDNRSGVRFFKGECSALAPKETGGENPLPAPRAATLPALETSQEASSKLWVPRGSLMGLRPPCGPWSSEVGVDGVEPLCDAGV